MAGFVLVDTGTATSGFGTQVIITRNDESVQQSHCEDTPPMEENAQSRREYALQLKPVPSALLFEGVLKSRTAQPQFQPCFPKVTPSQASVLLLATTIQATLFKGHVITSISLTPCNQNFSYAFKTSRHH